MSEPRNEEVQETPSTSAASTRKRSSAKRSTAKRGAAKRSSAKRSSAKRGTAKRSTAKRGAAKKSTAARKSGTRERKTQPLSAALVKRVKTLSKGGKTLQEIADSLNKSKETTARGLPWTTQNVWHVLRRK